MLPYLPQKSETYERLLIPMTNQTAPTGDNNTTKNWQLLFVTCVSPERSHPSGALAARYRDSGAEVAILFENARSPRQTLQDARRLSKLLAQGNFDRGLLNLNGSLSQLFAVATFARYRIPCDLWIMDSYPGCLQYVTRNWLIWWLPSYLASWVVKRCVSKIFVIDEDFANHAPSSPAIRARTQYVPLPTDSKEKPKKISQSGPHTIGIIGNIESDWMRDSFSPFFEQAKERGFRVLIATSRDIELPVQNLPDLEVVFPWRNEDTDRIFSKCDSVLLPISSSRLIYSSPSKIIESYVRGIQPILMTDSNHWAKQKSRKVYQKCLHIDEVFAGRPAHTPEELHTFSAHWADTWETVMARTIKAQEDR